MLFVADTSDQLEKKVAIGRDVTDQEIILSKRDLKHASLLQATVNRARVAATMPAARGVGLNG